MNNFLELFEDLLHVIVPLPENLWEDIESVNNEKESDSDSESESEINQKETSFEHFESDDEKDVIEYSDKKVEEKLESVTLETPRLSIESEKKESFWISFLKYFFCCFR